MLSVISTPNHTGSQPKWAMMGRNSGRKMKKMEMPSMNMPASSKMTLMASSIAVSDETERTRKAAMCSKVPSALLATANTEASARMVRMTAETSHASTSTS